MRNHSNLTTRLIKITVALSGVLTLMSCNQPTPEISSSPLPETATQESEPLQTSQLEEAVANSTLLPPQETNHLKIADASQNVSAKIPGQTSSTPIKIEVAKAALLTPAQTDTLISLDSFSKYEFDGCKESQAEGCAQWNGLPYGIILPTYIPPGFKVSDVSISKFDGRDGPGGYALKYANDIGQCFQLSTATGGLGAGTQDYQIVEVISPALGRVKVGYTKFSQYSSAPEISLWVSQGKISYLFDSPSGCESNISFKEATQIVESLDYLNPIPEGYPPTEQWAPM